MATKVVSWVTRDLDLKKILVNVKNPRIEASDCVSQNEIRIRFLCGQRKPASPFERLCATGAHQVASHAKIRGSYGWSRTWKRLLYFPGVVISHLHLFVSNKMIAGHNESMFKLAPQKIAQLSGFPLTDQSPLQLPVAVFLCTNRMAEA